MYDLAGLIGPQIALSPLGSKRFRVFEVDKDGRRQREYIGTEMLGSLSDVNMYAEVRRPSLRITLHEHRWWPPDTRLD